MTNAPGIISTWRVCYFALGLGLSLIASVLAFQISISIFGDESPANGIVFGLYSLLISIATAILLSGIFDYKLERRLDRLERIQRMTLAEVRRHRPEASLTSTKESDEK